MSSHTPAHIGVKWVLDEVQERLAKQLGFEYRSQVIIPTSEINIDASLKNNARPAGQLDNEHVLELAELMSSGNPFHMVWAYATERKGFIIAHGNHRVSAAMRLGEDSVMAYLITGPANFDKELLPRYCRQANAWDLSSPLSRDERYVQARHLIYKEGLTPSQAAGRVGLTGNLLMRWLRNDELKDELREKDVPVDHLQRGHMDTLNPFQDRAVMKEVACTFVKFKVSVDEAKDISKEIRASSTVAEQKAKLEKVVKRLRDQKQTSMPLDETSRIRLSFSSGIGRIANLLGDRRSRRQILESLNDGERTRVKDLADALYEIAKGK